MFLFFAVFFVYDSNLFYVITMCSTLRLLLCVLAACSGVCSVKPGKWELKNDKGVRCLELDSGISLSIQYNSTTGTETAHFDVPENATILQSESICGPENSSSFSLDSNDQKLVLVFGEGQKLVFLISQDLEFTQSKNKSWNMYKIQFLAQLGDADLFPGSAETGEHEYSNFVQSNGTGSLKFTSSLKEYWSCSPQMVYALGHECNITLSSLKLVPYATFDASDKTAHHCSKESRTNDLVPLIVGASLALLVVVVLIAYIISHVRANRAKYENVR